MRCKKCNNLLNEDVNFCQECGEPTDKYVNNRKRDDRDDDEDEGGFLDSIGNVLGKLFGG